MRDFFVSYNAEDQKWAEWIAWQLEAAEFTVVIQAWDFASNWLLRMDEAMRETKRTIAVLSPSYVRAVYTHPEWADAFRKDPTGAKDLLIPVRVQPTDISGVLSQIVYVDLVEIPENVAVERLLKRVRGERNKPAVAPGFPGSAASAAPRRAGEVKPPYPAEEEDTTRLTQAREILVGWRSRYGGKTDALRAAAKKARAWTQTTPSVVDDEVTAVVDLGAAVVADLRAVPLSHLKFATAYGLAVHPTIFWGQALTSVESTHDAFGGARSDARKRFDAARKALGIEIEEAPEKYAFEMLARVLESAHALAHFPLSALPRGFVKAAGGDAPRIEDIRSYRTLVVARTDDDVGLQLLALDDKQPTRLGSFAARTLSLNALCARRDAAGWIDLVATDEQYLYRWSGTSQNPTAQYERKTTLAGSFVTLGGEPAVVTVDADGAVRRLDPDGGTTIVARAPDGVRLREAALWTDPFQPRRWRAVGATERHDLVSISAKDPPKMRSSASLWDDSPGGNGAPRWWNDVVSVGVHQLDGFPCILVTRRASTGEFAHFLDPVLLNPLRAPMFIAGFVSRLIIVSGRWLVGFFMQRGTEVLPRVAVWDLRSDSNRPVGRLFEQNGDVYYPFITNASASGFDALFVLKPLVDDTRHRLCRLSWPAGSVDVLAVEPGLRVLPVA
jgi:TIR domain